MKPRYEPITFLAYALLGRSSFPMVNTRSLSVLVIDDEAGVAKSVDMLLRRYGCTVTATLFPKQALAIAQSLQPDVVLTDADMPGLNGGQLVKQLRADPMTAHIPIVLMTGVAEAHHFTHIPWDAFIQKPFGAKELFELVQRTAEKRLSGGR